jgi:hypothetical protein
MAQEIEAGASEQTALTVYNQNFALVKDRRKLKLGEGRNAVLVQDVATRLDRTSVHFKSLTAPDAVAVREQNYQYDLINPETLLSKSEGKRVAILQHLGDGQTRRVEGTIVTAPREILRGFDAYGREQTGAVEMVVRAEDGSLLLAPQGEITLFEMPEGLIPRPRLFWLVDCDQAGTHDVEISYLTEGINWRADYVVVVSASETSVDLTGWVTLDNQSGVTYAGAALQLVAGDVRRIKPELLEYDVMAMAAEAPMRHAAKPQFEQEKLFDYHLYTLDGTTTVRQNEQKQMTLLNANDVPAKKQYRYIGNPVAFFRVPEEHYDTRTDQKVKVYMDVENRTPNLGIPLPKGKMRLFKADRRGGLQFVGEDEIDHTPKDETLHLYVGDAFDLKGEHRRLDFRRSGRRVVEEKFEIALRNHSESNVEIVVVEKAFGTWEVLQRSHAFTKTNASTLEFTVLVPASGEAKITYTLRTSW